MLNEIFDLFANLDATDEQLDFPVLYGSGRNGWMALDPAGPKESLAPMFDLVLAHVPPPSLETGALRMLATTLEADPFLGRILTGRITSGVLKPGQPLKALNRDGKLSRTSACRRCSPSAAWSACRSIRPRRARSSPLPA